MDVSLSLSLSAHSRRLLAWDALFMFFRRGDLGNGGGNEFWKVMAGFQNVDLGKADPDPGASNLSKAS